MEKYFLFTLFGPMASWGDTAVGETRPSHLYPTKSAIVGLCAAALGIKREENEKLSQLSASLNFAVCVEREGRVMIDYHTTQVPSKASLKNKPHQTRRDELMIDDPNTILSTRDYYCDALYTIILWRDKSNTSVISLEQLEQSLKKPKFVLYLGRKSCPLALPTLEKMIEATTIEAAIQTYDQDPLRMQIINDIFINEKKNSQWLFADSAIPTELDPHRKQKRKDHLLHRGAWQYSDREEYVYDLSPAGGSA